MNSFIAERGFCCYKSLVSQGVLAMECNGGGRGGELSGPDLSFVYKRNERLIGEQRVERLRHQIEAHGVKVGAPYAKLRFLPQERQ